MTKRLHAAALMFAALLLVLAAAYPAPVLADEALPAVAEVVATQEPASTEGQEVSPEAGANAALPSTADAEDAELAADSAAALESEPESEPADILLAENASITEGGEEIDNGKYEELDDPPADTDMQDLIELLGQEIDFEKVWINDEGADEVTIRVEWQLDFALDADALYDATTGKGVNETTISKVLRMYWQIRPADRAAVLDALSSAFTNRASQGWERLFRLGLMGEYRDAILGLIDNDSSIIDELAGRPSEDVFADASGKCWLEFKITKADGWKVTLKGVTIPNYSADEIQREYQAKYDELYERYMAEAEDDYDRELARTLSIKDAATYIIELMETSAAFVSLEEDLDLDGNVVTWEGNAQDGFTIYNEYEEPKPTPESEPTPEPETTPTSAPAAALSPTVLPATGDAAAFAEIVLFASAGLSALAISARLRRKSE